MWQEDDRLIKVQVDNEEEDGYKKVRISETCKTLAKLLRAKAKDYHSNRLGRAIDKLEQAFNDGSYDELTGIDAVLESAACANRSDIIIFRILPIFKALWEANWVSVLQKEHNQLSRAMINAVRHLQSPILDVQQAARENVEIVIKLLKDACKKKLVVGAKWYQRRA